jgi:hypothetical protein
MPVPIAREFLFRLGMWNLIKKLHKISKCCSEYQGHDYMLLERYDMLVMQQKAHIPVEGEGSIVLFLKLSGILYSA